MKLAPCRVKLWSGNGGSGKKQAMHPVEEGGNKPSGSERDCQSYLTTFNSPFGRYRFNCIPFGLKMSQDIFQTKIDQTFEGCEGVGGIADNIVVFGKTSEENDCNMLGLVWTGEQCRSEMCFLKPPALKSIALRILMAETLEETLNKRKTRVPSSDESSISNASPESKKLKSGEHAVRVHEVSELDTRRRKFTGLEYDRRV